MATAGSFDLADHVLASSQMLLGQPNALYATCVLGLLLVLVSVYKYRRLDLDKIPSPTFWELLQLCLDVPKANEWFRRCHEKYGPIFRFRMFYRELVLVADTQVAAQVLTTGPSYLPQKCYEYTALDPAHGMHGYTAMLSHLDEKLWKAHRSAISPAYTLSAIKPLQPSIMAAIAEMGQRISNKVQSGPAVVCIDHQMLATTIHIELESFMKVPLGELGVDPLKLADDMAVLVLMCQTFTHNLLKKAAFSTPFLAQITKNGREFNAARMRFTQLTERVVDEMAARGPYADKDYSLAACLMRIQDPYRPGQKAAKAVVAAEVANSLLATETVPATVAWTLYMTSIYPEVQERLVDELAAAGVPIGAGPQAAAAVLLNPDTIKRLTYLQAVVSESMRMHPAGAPASNRVADRPVQVGPYMIPAGTYVWPCMYAIMTYSGNWNRPLEFDPDRWKNPAAGIHPKTGAARFVPFSIGPKSCAAQNLALMEVRWAVALLLACFKFSVAPQMGSHEDVLARTEMGFVYRPIGGILLTAEQR